MDVTESIFWQNLLLIVLLVPYIIGICISTYYAQKQRRSDLLRNARRHIVEPTNAKADNPT
jgi:hypothetical protein